MKLQYRVDRDFFSPCYHPPTRHSLLATARKRRIRRVRLWALRRAWREVLESRVGQACVMIGIVTWSLNAIIWLLEKI